MVSGFNIVDQIFRDCDEAAVALIQGDLELSYGELRGLVDSATASLRESGWIQSSEERVARVGIFLPNGVAHIVYSLAVLRSGGCLAPVPGELTHAERDQLVERVGLDVVIAGDGQPWHRDATESIQIGEWREPVELHRGIHSGAALDFDEAALAAVHPALIRFSSGTTGRSKGVVLSHETLWDRVRTCNTRLRIGQEDRVIWSLPMAHHFAVSIVLYLAHGATTILADSNLAEDTYAAVERWGGTVLYGSPFHYAMLAEYPEGKPMPSVRLAVSTAAPLGAETAKAFQERYEFPLTQGLGVIEVGLPLLNDLCAEANPLAIGTPQGGFEVRIRGDQGEDLPAGELGEILLRGPGMFDAYLSPWRTREEATADGWFETGDLGYIDASGAVVWKGRLKSVINVAGMKVFAEEVEEALGRHPEVVEAKASGTPHPLMGEVVGAEVVLRDPESPPTPASLKAICREYLSSHKVPVLIKFVENLPRTSSGKIKR